MPKKSAKRSKPKTRAGSKRKAGAKKRVAKAASGRAKRASTRKRARAGSAKAVVLRKQVKVEMPVWFQPQAALGSAVRYVSSLSPKFNWVGIYVLKGNTLELGPFIGAKTEHTRIQVGQGVCGTAVARDADMNVPDVSQSDNYLACSFETKSELVVLVRDPSGKVVGQIDIDSHTPAAFGPQEEQAVKKVAQELGELWPE